MRYINPAAAQLVYGISAVVLTPIYLFVFNKTEAKMQWQGAVFAGLAYVVAAIASFAYSYALTTRPVSEAVLWTAPYPMLTCLLAMVFFGESMTAMKLVGLAFVLIGVVIVSQ